MDKGSVCIGILLSRSLLQVEGPHPSVRREAEAVQAGGMTLFPEEGADLADLIDPVGVAEQNLTMAAAVE